MKLRTLCAFLLTSIALSAAAQDRQTDGPTAADFFIKAPFDVASQLAEISRLDMIDYFTNGSTVKSENRLGRKVGLVSLSDGQVVWQDEDSVKTTLTVLPMTKSAKADTLLVVITTVNGLIPDSEVRYFNKNWETLIRKDLPKPQLKDWLNVTDKKTVAEVEQTLPFILSTAEYDGGTNTLVITNRTADYYPTNEQPEAINKLKTELRYEWNGVTFKPSLR
ncbi:MAG: DUF3256 family protein [Muribaculaceae bacterium]|nr:DUF3256 family protein [Muribaculaceae bacterium]